MMLIGGVVLVILLVVGWLLFGLSAGGVIPSDAPSPAVTAPTVTAPAVTAPTVTIPPPPPPPPPPPSAAYTKQPIGGDWWGSDIANYPTSDPEACATNCNSATGCVAFVTATDSQNCWIKSKIDSTQYHPATTRQYYTKPGTSLPALPSWQCMTGDGTYYAPLRKGASGDIECMSKDGRNCEWKQGKAACDPVAAAPVSPMNPLACGNAHNSLYGMTGYTTPGHWCAAGRAALG